jgi:hypothetical protein
MKLSGRYTILSGSDQDSGSDIILKSLLNRK